MHASSAVVPARRPTVKFDARMMRSMIGRSNQKARTPLLNRYIGRQITDVAADKSLIYGQTNHWPGSKGACIREQLLERKKKREQLLSVKT